MVDMLGKARREMTTVPVANKIIDIINEANLDYREIKEVVDIVEHALDWRMIEMKPRLKPFALSE